MWVDADEVVNEDAPREGNTLADYLTDSRPLPQSSAWHRSLMLVEGHLASRSLRRPHPHRRRPPCRCLYHLPHHRPCHRRPLASSTVTTTTFAATALATALATTALTTTA